jgi:hypothetical protein
VGAPFTATSAPLRRRIALFCLVLAVALLFHRVLLGEGVLFFRDVCLNHLPTRIYTTPILRSGHLPLWNPYLSGGMPLAANPNNLVFHPITLLFFIMPVFLAFHVSILVQYLLAGWGILRWGREEGLREESALAGALTYMLSGVLVSCGSLQNLLSSWAWVPVGLFALARHRRTGSRKALLAFSAVLAVQLLAGDPLAAGTSVLLGLVEIRWGRDGQLQRFLPAALRLVCGVLLGCALAMIQILPAREMLAQSGRASGIPFADSSAWSIPPVRLLELIVPSLYGDPTALKVTSYWGGRVFQKGYPFLLSIYIGAIPLLLGLCALGRREDRRARALAVLAFLAVLASLGTASPIYGLLYRHVPLISSMRYPSRFLLPAFLCLSLLAALGLERLREELAWIKLGPGTRILVVGMALMVLITAIPGFSPAVAERLVLGGLRIPASVGAAAIQSIVASLRGSLLRSTLLAGGMAAMILAVRRARLDVSLAGLLILLAVGADLIAANSHMNPVVPVAFYDVHPPLLDLLREDDGQVRVYSTPRPQGFAVMAQSDSAWWGYYWDEISARVSTALPHRIGMAYDKSTDLLSPLPVNALSDRMKDLEPERIARLADIASVGVVMSYREMEDASLIPAGQVARQTNVPLRFYRNPDPLPRAYLVLRARPESGDAFLALTDPAFDPRSEVYLAGNEIPSGETGPAGRAAVVESLPERVVVDVSANRQGWLVLTDNFYPGWVAERGGVQLPIRRANYLFRAVKVPEGDSRVIFRYRPFSLLAGAASSLAAMVGGIAWAWRSRGSAA